MILNTLEQIRDALTPKCEKAQQSVAKFQARIADKPSLEHVDYAFEALAQVDVYGQVLEAIQKKLDGDPESKMTFDTLLEYIHREVESKGGWVESGSSHSGKIHNRYVLAAWAKVLNTIRSGF